MKGEEFKVHVEAIGLSVYAAAPYLGISKRQAYRISAGEYEAPGAAAKLLRLMVSQGLTHKDVE